MLKDTCPMCGSNTIQTADDAAVCPHCETSVQSFKHVTIIQPRSLHVS
jgi:uncharacterized Zn finger protein (UPF0148 family)